MALSSRSILCSLAPVYYCTNVSSLQPSRTKPEFWNLICIPIAGPRFCRRPKWSRRTEQERTWKSCLSDYSALHRLRTRYAYRGSHPGSDDARRAVLMAINS